MTSNWLRRHPLLGYYALTFGISWGGILIIVAASGSEFSPMLPLEGGLILLAMVLGLSVSGLALTALLNGRAGLRQLVARLLLWRVGVAWYAVALLTIPTFQLAILWPLSAVVDPLFAPKFQWQLLVVGLIAASFEKIGWTGFATPQLLAQSDLHASNELGRVLGKAGLSLGVI